MRAFYRVLAASCVLLAAISHNLGAAASTTRTGGGGGGSGCRNSNKMASRRIKIFKGILERIYPTHWSVVTVSDTQDTVWKGSYGFIHRDRDNVPRINVGRNGSARRKPTRPAGPPVENDEKKLCQGECPRAEGGVELLACPSADHQGRVRCIDDRNLCDRRIHCANGEDENLTACMFHKVTRHYIRKVLETLFRRTRNK